jgi:hypothetical protein
MKLFDIAFWLIFGITVGYIYSGIEFLQLLPELEALCISG